MDYRPFCIEAHLVTPIACSPSSMPPVALDGLLARAYLCAKGIKDTPIWKSQLKPADIDIPLARIEVAGRDVWAGSIGFPVGPVKWQRFGWTKKWTGPRRWTGEGWEPHPGSGCLRDYLEHFYCIAVPKVRFYGFGDPKATLELLQENITSLGHKHKRGFGRVAKWELRETAVDHSVWLQTKNAVYPARPLPLGAADEEQVTAVVMQGTLDVPHWLREERKELLFPPPFLWQEGLEDGDPNEPEPNPAPESGTASVFKWLSDLCSEWEEEMFGN